MTYDTKNCFSRLPCGMCRLTNKMCPFVEDNTNTWYSPTCAVDKYKTNYAHVETKTEMEE